MLGLLILPIVYAAVEQVHLSYNGDQTEMIVTWISFRNESTAQPRVHYGAAPGGDSSTQFATVTEWTDKDPDKTTRYTYRATINRLTPGTKYYYSVGSDFKMSKVFSFTSLDSRKPLRAAIFGDLALHGGQIYDLLQNLTDSEEIDIIFHIGDISYSLDTSGGRRGDQFMNKMEGIMSRIPYQVLPGNYETSHDFNHFRNRFTMPSSGAKNSTGMWSFVIGPTKFIALNTEYYSLKNTDMIRKQFDWLKEKLEENSSRWTVVLMHRPMYCSSVAPKKCGDSVIRQQLEPLLAAHNVDLVYAGHRHVYERTWPILNGEVKFQPQDNVYIDPKAPIYIISGAAGHALNDTETPSKVSAKFSAATSSEHGVSLLKIHSSHLLRTSFMTSKGQLFDQVDIYKGLV